jgi:hypothetical protein
MELSMVPDELDNLTTLYEFKVKHVISPTLFYTGELLNNRPVGRGFIYCLENNFTFDGFFHESPPEDAITVNEMGYFKQGTMYFPKEKGRSFMGSFDEENKFAFGTEKLSNLEIYQG